MKPKIDPKFRQNFLKSRRIKERQNRLDVDISSCSDNEEPQAQGSSSFNSDKLSPPAKAVGNLQRNMTQLTISKTRDEECLSNPPTLKSALEKAPREDEDDGMSDDDEDDIFFNKGARLRYRGKVVDFSTMDYP